MWIPPQFSPRRIRRYRQRQICKRLQQTLPEARQSNRNLLSRPPNAAPDEVPLTKTIGLTLFRRCISAAALLLAAFAFAPSARCQGDTELGVWGAYSLGTPHLIGVTSNRQLGELALRYGHSIYDWSNVSLEYTLDVIPVEIVRQPKYAACGTNPNNFPTGFCETGRENVYGAGINPLGLKLNFRRQHQ